MLLNKTCIIEKDNEEIKYTCNILWNGQDCLLPNGNLANVTPTR